MKTGSTLILLCTMLPLFLLTAGTAGAVELFFDPALIHVTYADTFTISVEAADLDSLRGYELGIRFDSGLVDFVDAEPGTLFDDYSPPHGLYWSVQDEDSLVQVECFIIPQDECLPGPGGILNLTFVALVGPGDSPLQITDASVRDCDGSPIEPVETADGLIVVEPGVALYFEPDLTYTYYPETFSVAVAVANLDSLRSYDLEIAFDDALLDFQEAAPGEVFDEYDPELDLDWTVDDLGSSVRVDLAIIAEGECAEAAGEILELTFTALDAHGESPLTFAAADLGDCDDSPIPVAETHGGQVVVGAAAELFFDPDPKHVAGPRRFSISLEVGPADSLRGFQVYLSYENDVIEFDSVYVGALLRVPEYPLWWYDTQPGPSQIRIEGVILGPGLFVDGPGELAELQFTSLVSFDTTEVIFDVWHLWDVNTDEFYPVAVDDGLIIIDSLLAVVPDPDPRPAEPQLTLTPAWGNPGPSPSLLCRTSEREEVLAVVYDLTGRAVRELTAQRIEGRVLRFGWDGTDNTGRAAAPGVYWLRVSSGRQAATRQVVLVR